MQRSWWDTIRLVKHFQDEAPLQNSADNFQCICNYSSWQAGWKVLHLRLCVFTISVSGHRRETRGSAITRNSVQHFDSFRLKQNLFWRGTATNISLPCGGAMRPAWEFRLSKCCNLICKLKRRLRQSFHGQERITGHWSNEGAWRRCHKGCNL